MRKDSKTYRHIKDQMNKFPEGIFRVPDLAPGVNPNKFYPNALSGNPLAIYQKIEETQNRATFSNEE